MPKLSPNKNCRTDKIVLAGKIVSYSIKVSDRAQNVRLQVGSQKGLVVTVPKGLKENCLKDILRKKQGWILDKMDYYGQIAEKKRLFEEKGGSRLLYRGQEYEV